jgi:hypothetical protein
MMEGVALTHEYRCEIRSFREEDPYVIVAVVRGAIKWISIPSKLVTPDVSQMTDSRTLFR